MPSTNGQGPRRAVLYARVSTEEQARSGYSLAQQMEALWDHTAREGYEVLDEVIDPGHSGASLARPGMDRVRDLVATGGVSVVGGGAGALDSVVIKSLLPLGPGLGRWQSPRGHFFVRHPHHIISDRVCI